MKKIIFGFCIGLLLATSIMTLASGQPIKLIVNGAEVFSDVPPQIINSRTMIPARPLAEALGAKVEWDAKNNAVVVTGGIQIGVAPTDLEPVKENISQSINNKGSENMEDVIIKETTFKGMRAIEINGDDYFNCVDFNGLFSDLYFLEYIKESEMTLLIENKSQKIIQEIPRKNIQIYRGLSYISVKYYPNTATGVISNL